MRNVEFIRCFYEPRACLGLSENEMINWKSRESQRLRFLALAGQTNLREKELLDVDCGPGALIGFLTEWGIRCQYTGVDVRGTMLEEAANHYPDGRYFHADLLNCDLFEEKSFDVVFLSKVFNLNGSDNIRFFTDTAEKLIPLAREIVGFNILHKNSPYRNFQNYYYHHPEEVTDILFPLLPKGSSILLVDKYMPNDMSVICRLTPE